MASYEVQVVQSSPFECVLRDRNQQQSCRDSNGKLSRASFKKNLKKFIKDHLLIDENSQNHNNANRPCLRPLKKDDKANNENGTEHRHHKLARVAVKFIDPNEEATRPESQTTPGASSLVQMWEARLKMGRTSSDVSCSEIGDGAICDETLSPDSEPQPEKTGESGQKERVRIVDIIKKLTHGRKENSKNEQQKQEEVNNGESDLSSCRESRLICTVAVTEERGGGGGSFQLQQIVSSPRLRGRQAFNNLLMQMQRERHLDLESLATRQAVSKFPQRGRIQSLLRLRSLHRCNAIQDQCRNQSRERFSQKNRRGHKSKGNKSQSLEVTCASSNQSSTVSFHVSGTLAACKEQEKDGDFEEATRNLESQETERDEESGTPRERESYECVVEAVTSWGEHEMVMQQDDEADYDHPLNYMANSYDWISEIARPRSYWEDLWKTWHEQALATSQNEDIRHLLQRKRVSTFLKSDFRERMDKLMLARLQLQPADSVIAFFQTQLQPQDDQERQEEDREEEEEASPYFETPSLSIQLPSPFMRSWSDQDHNDAPQESDQLCTSSPSDSSPAAPFQVQSYCHGPPSPSSINHPSLEMELICDLKGQIERLHSEMAELRKSVVSCTDLQMKMHQSFSTVATQKNTDSNERSACKRSCIMCHEMPVDSLLYRCGHMCTCMSCGQKLQLNRGKCPVCKASIADVVQAYLDA